MTDGNFSKIVTPRGDGRSMTDLSASAVTTGFPSTAPGTGSDWFGPLAPMNPVAPPEVAGRAWDFPAGFNLNTQPRPYEDVPFHVLRRLADSYEPVRLIIERRKDQLARAEWTIRPKHERAGLRSMNAQIPDAMRARIAETTSLLKRPSWGVNFRQLVRGLVEDLLVLDSPSIFLHRNQRGTVVGLSQIDGSLIKRVVDDWGRTPKPIAWDGRTPFTWNDQTITCENFKQLGWEYFNGMAWPVIAQQVLKQLPAANLTALSLIYAPLNVRPGKAYGYSPTEQIMLTIATATRRAMSQLQYFTEGNQVDSFFTLPESWGPDQVMRMQDWYDSMYAGDTGNRRKMKFMAGGKYQATREPPLKSEVDEWLIRICCFAFSYPPQAFVALSNRSTAEQLEKTAEEEGLGPIKQWAADVFNEIISVHLGYDDIEFEWVESKEVDQKKQSMILSAYTAGGIMTPNEAREALGLAPSADPGANELTVRTATGNAPIGTAISSETER